MGGGGTWDMDFVTSVERTRSQARSKRCDSLGPYRVRNPGNPKSSYGVRVRFCVRFQAVKVPIFGGFPVESPTNKATASKLF